MMVYLFDIDGVINKSDYFSVQYEKDFGVPPEIFNNFFFNDFDKFARGKANLKTEISQYFQEWKWEKSASEFLDYWFKNDIELDFDLINSIQQLRQKGNKCFLVSQQEENRKKYLWKNKNLKNYFDGIYCTCDFRYLKSEKKFYEVLIKEFQEMKFINSENDLIYWDDSKIAIENASKTGIKSIFFTKNEDILNII